MAIFSTKDVDMHFEITSGLLPVDTLFIHGYLATNEWWHPVRDIFAANSLAKKERDSFTGAMILGEWRGSGQTSAVNQSQDLDLELLARDYINLVTHLGYKQINIVAHSFGCLIAWQALQMSPDLFDKALFLAPISPHSFKTKFDDQLKANLQKFAEDRDLRNQILEKFLYKCDQQSQTYIDIVAAGADKTAPAVWQKVPELILNYNGKGALSQIKHVCRVVAGDSDPWLSLKDAHALSKLFTHGSLVEVKGHGHSLQLEDPQQFVALYQDFYNSAENS